MCGGGWSVCTHCLNSVTLENPDEDRENCITAVGKDSKTGTAAVLSLQPGLVGKWAQVTRLIALEVFLHVISLKEEASCCEGLQQQEGYRVHSGSGLPGGAESHSLNENRGNERSCFHGCEKLGGLELHLYFKSQALG